MLIPIAGKWIDRVLHQSTRKRLQLPFIEQLFDRLAKFEAASYDHDVAIEHK